jgi:hypothetical protein
MKDRSALRPGAAILILWLAMGAAELNGLIRLTKLIQGTRVGHAHHDLPAPVGFGFRRSGSTQNVEEA